MKLTCRQAGGIQHRLLDGDLLDAMLRRAFDEHLETCADCRERDSELRAIQVALRELPVHPMPEAALEKVWDQTIREPVSAADRFTNWGLGWKAVAAAIVMAAAFLFALQRNVESRPSQAEVDQAAAEARMVLKIAANALRRAEDATVDAVLGDEVSNALGRVPIRWPVSETGDAAGAAAGTLPRELGEPGRTRNENDGFESRNSENEV